MKLAISNIAWDASEDKDVYAMMKTHGFSGLEIAPSRVWGKPLEETAAGVEKFTAELSEYGIRPAAMQALLFGKPELKIFESKNNGILTFEYLKKMILLASGLKIKPLVFGSPKNRSTGGIDKKIAEKIAVDFFSELGSFAAKNDACVCIEPNPPAYGTDFINTTREGAEFVKKVNNPGFKLHIDTGAMITNDEEIENTLGEMLRYAAHFHVSEPDLLPVPQDSSEKIHRTIAAILKESDYGGYISIEMKKIEQDGRLENIERALSFVRETYGCQG